MVLFQLNLTMASSLSYNKTMQQSFLQSDIWAEFKKDQGWGIKHALGLLVMERKLPLGRSFLYIPELTLEEQDSGLAALAARAQSALSHCKTPTTIFGRAEFLIPTDERRHDVLVKAHYVKAHDEVQPEWRQEIDITQVLNDIKVQMKPKGRYNIGVAEKHGVVVEYDVSDEAVNQFIALNDATAQRKKYVGRSGDYLRNLIKLLDKNGVGGLWVAKHEEEILAGAVINFWHNKASYLYGASSDQKRNVMAPHLLHFEIMAEAQRRGCAIYDMIGVAPLDAPESHPWYGISRFKKEFGGETVHYLGSYDRVFKPLWYTAFSALRKK